MITIPLSGGASRAHQIFTFNDLQFTLNYITVTGPAWSVDIHKEGELITAGFMLEPNATIETSEGIYAFVGSDVTLDNLGVDNKLVWVDNE